MNCAIVILFNKLKNVSKKNKILTIKKKYVFKKKILNNFILNGNINICLIFLLNKMRHFIMVIFHCKIKNQVYNHHNFI